MSPILLVVLSTLGSPPPPSCPAVPAQSPAPLHCCTLASGQLCCSQVLDPGGTVSGCGCRP